MVEVITIIFIEKTYYNLERTERRKTCAWKLRSPSDISIVLFLTRRGECLKENKEENKEPKESLERNGSDNNC